MNETSSTLDDTSTMSSFVFLLFARIHSANDTSVFSISKQKTDRKFLKQSDNFLFSEFSMDFSPIEVLKYYTTIDSKSNKLKHTNLMEKVYQIH